MALGVGGAVSLAEDVYQNDPYVESLPSEHSGPRTVPGHPPGAYLYELESVASVGGVDPPYPDFKRAPALQGVSFNWFAAQAFVNHLKDTFYLRHDDWRLPRMLDGACPAATAMRWSPATPATATPFPPTSASASSAR